MKRQNLHKIIYLFFNFFFVSFLTCEPTFGCLFTNLIWKRKKHGCLFDEWIIRMSYIPKFILYYVQMCTTNPSNGWAHMVDYSYTRCAVDYFILFFLFSFLLLFLIFFLSIFFVWFNVSVLCWWFVFTEISFEFHIIPFKKKKKCSIHVTISFAILFMYLRILFLFNSSFYTMYEFVRFLFFFFFFFFLFVSLTTHFLTLN